MAIHYNSSLKHHSRAGSALIVSVIFSMVIMLVLAGLFPLLMTDWKLSAKTSTQEATFTLAE